MKFIIPEVIWHRVEVPDDVFIERVMRLQHKKMGSIGTEPNDIHGNIRYCIAWQDPTEFADLIKDSDIRKLFASLEFDRGNPKLNVEIEK